MNKTVLVILLLKGFSCSADLYGGVYILCHSLQFLPVLPLVALALESAMIRSQDRCEQHTSVFHCIAVSNLAPCDPLLVQVQPEQQSC